MNRERLEELKETVYEVIAEATNNYPCYKDEYSKDCIDLITLITAEQQRRVPIEPQRELMKLDAYQPTKGWEVNQMCCGADSGQPKPSDDVQRAFVHSDPEILGGLPCISGTRIPVSFILSMIDSDMTLSEICTDFILDRQTIINALRQYQPDGTSRTAMKQKLAGRRDRIEKLESLNRSLVAELQQYQSEPCAAIKSEKRYWSGEDGDIELGHELHCSNCKASLGYQNSSAKCIFCPACGRKLKDEVEK